jgi:hypothetical protein
MLMKVMRLAELVQNLMIIVLIENNDDKTKSFYGHIDFKEIGEDFKLINKINIIK